MKKIITYSAGALMVMFFLSAPVFAHTPLCSCDDNGDGTITCEGGFSDGSSAAGVEMRALNSSGNVIIKGKMNEDSEFTFKQPHGSYKVEFNAGPGHLVEVPGSDITE